ncbi:lasso RiPP family leader peptide-containing protein [Streptomyces sp. 4N509B]
MSERTHIEETEVYEPPVLAEVGDYAELTHGSLGELWDGWTGLQWA